MDISKPTERNCNKTQSGLNCQRWDVNSPHDVMYKPIVSIHNNCASPDGDDKPWCYTTDPKVRWEHCQSECNINPIATTTTSSTTTMTTTTTTTSTTTPTPKPVEINRTHNTQHHYIVPSYNHTQCWVKRSNKLKSKLSKYSAKGYCWRDCYPSITRSMSSTGWETSLPGDSKIYYADDKATSFDFPWFVRVGMGYYWIGRYVFLRNGLKCPQ